MRSWHADLDQLMQPFCNKHKIQNMATQYKDVHSKTGKLTRDQKLCSSKAVKKFERHVFTNKNDC